MSEHLEKFNVDQYEGDEGKPVYNFSPGPCILPRAVLDTCSRDMISYRGSGRSVMELNHRSPEFIFIDDMTKKEIKDFLNVPDTHVVMLQ
jgi:phosphoserine aminotransferase